MRIVAISSLGPGHRYVLQQLNSVFPITAVIQPTLAPVRKPRSRAAKIARLLFHPLKVASGRWNDWWKDRRETRDQHEVEAALFPGSETSWDLPQHPIRRDQLHSPETLALIDRYQPDLIVTAGCPLLRPELFDRPRFGTINLHWGISPAYAGEDTLFWPLYRHDLQNMGVTLHRIDETIDGGPCLRQGRMRCENGDTEVSSTIRAARLAAPLLIEIVSEMAAGRPSEGTKPTGPGKLYRRRDRRWYHDVKFWWNHSRARSTVSKSGTSVRSAP